MNGRVVIRRPLIAVAAAVVVALAVGFLPAGTTTPGRSASGVTATAGAPTSEPACRGTRESLRPIGPLPAPGAMPPGSSMAAIVARGRLVAGVDQSKYLAGYRNAQTGRFEGADIDIVRGIATALFGDPERVQYIVVPVADRAAAVRDGRVDVLVNNFSVTCDRQRSVEFSTAYRATAMRVMVIRGSGITNIDAAAGQRVCTSANSAPEQVLRALPQRLDLVTLAGVPECTVELQRGHVAAVASDDDILAGLAAQDPQLQIVGPPFGDVTYGVGMRLDRPDLVRFVNAVLERGRADGTLAASDRRWFAGWLDPVPTPAPAVYRD